MTPQQNYFIYHVIRALTWRLDVAEDGMVERSENGVQYCRTHLSYESMTQKNLDLVCEAVNNLFIMCNSNLRIDNSMGEFIPISI